MLSTDSDILTTAEAWVRGGRSVALATVTDTWGSAPRRTELVLIGKDLPRDAIEAAFRSAAI
jgi:hypothetical protein